MGMHRPVGGRLQRFSTHEGGEYGCAMNTRLLGYVRRHHVGLLALMVALGGTSYAAVSLPAKSVGKQQLKRGAVTAKKLRRDAVRTNKVLDGSLLAADFAAEPAP